MLCLVQLFEKQLQYRTIHNQLYTSPSNHLNPMNSNLPSLFPLLTLSLLLISTSPLNFDKAIDDYEGQYFASYVQHMNNYIARQTFSFDIQHMGSFKIMIEKSPGDRSIRGMIFTETDIDHALDVKLTQGKDHIQSLSNVRMGILFGNLTDNGIIVVEFKNLGQAKTILFSYELINEEQKRNKNHVYSKQFQKTIKKYTSIHDDIQQSELLNTANIKTLLATSKRILYQQNQAYFYAVIETIVLLTFWIVSLLMLQKVIKSRYTSII